MTTTKNLAVKSTILWHCKIHKHTWDFLMAKHTDLSHNDI
jgi:hypothetical protein